MIGARYCTVSFSCLRLFIIATEIQSRKKGTEQTFKFS